MARQKPETSSYDRVNKLIAGTQEWRDLARSAREALAEGPVQTGVRYEYGSVWDPVAQKGVPQGKAVFWATVALPYDDKRLITLVSEKQSETSFSEYTLFENALFKPVFESCFGKPVVPGRKRLKVPTFNCKEDKAWDEFKSFARDQMGSECREEMRSLRDAVLVAWSRFTQEEIEAGKLGAFHAQAVKDIKAEVLKWYDRVPASVIKDALDECIVHAIMES